MSTGDGSAAALDALRTERDKLRAAAKAVLDARDDWVRTWVLPNSVEHNRNVARCEVAERALRALVQPEPPVYGPWEAAEEIDDEEREAAEHVLLLSIPPTRETHPGPFQECPDERCYPAWSKHEETTR